MFWREMRWSRQFGIYQTTIWADTSSPHRKRDAITSSVPSEEPLQLPPRITGDAKYDVVRDTMSPHQA